MKKHLLRFTAALLLVLSLPAFLLLNALALPECYGGAYYAELSRMFERLCTAEGPRLILIGGSSIAFGVDTELLEKNLRGFGYDYTVCPFGLYAAVGTSAMLELARDQLRAGDIVVLAVEPTSDTMSAYFGATAFWKCCESDTSMILALSKDQQNAMAGNYISYYQERAAIRRNGDLPQTEGAYALSSFNEHCNMVYDRPGNTMALGYDTAAPVTLGEVVIDPAFAEQVNSFYADANAAGAEVWFSFSPVNRSAVTDPEHTADFFDLCNRTFNCPVISDPARYILDHGWFYDSNFHLNSFGSLVRTWMLTEDLLAQLGYYGKVEWTMPEMPASAAVLEQNDADNADFTYSQIPGGWLISGLSEQGQTKTELTAPASYDGNPVVGFTADALRGAQNLASLRLSESIESIPDGLFADCPHLTDLILEHRTHLCSIGDEPFAGADDLRILVPTESYHLYRDGDGCETNPWSAYLKRIFTYG